MYRSIHTTLLHPKYKHLFRPRRQRSMLLLLSSIADCHPFLPIDVNLGRARCWNGSLGLSQQRFGRILEQRHTQWHTVPTSLFDQPLPKLRVKATGLSVPYNGNRWLLLLVAVFVIVVAHQECQGVTCPGDEQFGQGHAGPCRSTEANQPLDIVSQVELPYNLFFRPVEHILLLLLWLLQPYDDGGRLLMLLMSYVGLHPHKSIQFMLIGQLIAQWVRLRPYRDG
mmetsp:Transcript_5411/g.11958  ORF Transcript_5411/g.11958 Transcript_5411/m.11958 type:complete len:225 (+) Transcript_5411:643-1317(+)